MIDVNNLLSYTSIRQVDVISVHLPLANKAGNPRKRLTLFNEDISFTIIYKYSQTDFILLTDNAFVHNFIYIVWELPFLPIIVHTASVHVVIFYTH